MSDGRGLHGQVIPDECQLCKLLDHNDDIREVTHSFQIANEDGGTKFIYACERCLDEMEWEHPLLKSEVERDNETKGPRSKQV